MTIEQEVQQLKYELENHIKNQHDTIEHLRDKIETLQKHLKDGGDGELYYCGNCGGFHLQRFLTRDSRTNKLTCPSCYPLYNTDLFRVALFRVEE